MSNDPKRFPPPAIARWQLNLTACLDRASLTPSRRGKTLASEPGNCGSPRMEAHERREGLGGLRAVPPTNERSPSKRKQDFGPVRQRFSQLLLGHQSVEIGRSDLG